MVPNTKVLLERSVRTETFVYIVYRPLNLTIVCQEKLANISLVPSFLLKVKLACQIANITTGVDNFSVNKHFQRPTCIWLFNSLYS